MDIKKIGIGLSGGKDSTVALSILNMYCNEREIGIIGLSVDEGIENYRAKSLNCAKNACDKLNIPIKIRAGRRPALRKTIETRDVKRSI